MRCHTLTAFRTSTNTWTIWFNSSAATITETSRRRRESAAAFATPVHISFQSDIARYVTAVGVFRSALRNRSARPFRAFLARAVEVNQRIHLCPKAGRPRFSRSRVNQIIKDGMVGHNAPNSGGHMFKAIAGIVAVAALTYSALWAAPLIYREYRMWRM